MFLILIYIFRSIIITATQPAHIYRGREREERKEKYAEHKVYLQLTGAGLCAIFSVVVALIRFAARFFITHNKKWN